MRVLQVIPSISAARGGPSRAMELIERALADQGVHSETATTNDDGPQNRLSVPLGQQISSAGKGHRLFFRKSTEFYQVALSFVPWIIREVRNYDVVHVHALFSFTSVVAAWAARRAGVPYVIRPLGVLTRYGIKQRRPFLKKLSLQFVEGPLLSGAAAVHFTSSAEEHEAEDLGLKLRSIVLPLGVDNPAQGIRGRALERWPFLEGQLCLLFLSRIDPKKNLEGLIRAMALLRAQSFPITLLVCGEGDIGYTRQLLMLARDEGVESVVHWLGHAAGELKADALAVADVFALPSHSENFGIAVVEALSAGLPCVVGHGVAVAGAIEQAGAGSAVNTDATAIADGLIPYLKSADRRAQAGEAARQLARQSYSVEAMGKGLVELYRSVKATRAVSDAMAKQKHSRS